MIRRILGIISFFALTVLAVGASGQPELGPGLYAEIETERGLMVFRLDYQRTPLTVTNFAGLAQGTLPNEVRSSGEPFYDGMAFYRVAKDYVVFAGDPTESGAGGPGYTFPRETGALLSAGSPGALVMDGITRESSGSRFFITVNGDAFLDTKYTAFGTLVHGDRVLRRIRQGDLIESIRIKAVGAEARHLIFDEAAFARQREAARDAEIETLRIQNPDLAANVLALGEGRSVSPSGMYYAVVRTGEGEKPVAGSRVSVHYTGTLMDGTVFDSSLPRGQTFDFTIGTDGVISGWVEAVMDMQVGEQRVVIVPPYLAYGSQGYGPIEANSWLRFEMELASVTGP